jgi:hypothetical protein
VIVAGRAALSSLTVVDPGAGSAAAAVPKFHSMKCPAGTFPVPARVGCG